MKRNRTDRILILAALAILLLAGSLFYFDNWMWGGRRSRNERIGMISDKAGDVRVKFEGDLKWSKAGRGQDLIYNDSIYAGASSNARLQLGQSEMNVQENTLVVLRRENAVNFMNLAFGNIFGKLGKNEKIVIDTGTGKPIELLSTSGASIEVSKIGGHSQVKVTKGVADMMINGKLTHVDSSVKIVDGKAQLKGMEEQALEVVSPLHTQVLYSEDPAKIGFEWRWANGRKPVVSEKYIVEFSSTDDFKQVHASKEVTGEMTTSLTAADSLSLYYRVRGPAGELSPVEQVNFVRMKKPLIVKPQPQTRIALAAGPNANVEIEFNRAENSVTWFEIASDADFKTVVSSDSTKETTAGHELPAGQYYLRAKSDFGNSHETGWTDAVPFSIDASGTQLDLPQAREGRYLIPNLSYPGYLYEADSAKVSKYLAGQGTLRGFFKAPAGAKVWVKFQDGEVVAQESRGWPKTKVIPGAYIYKYQITKTGFGSSLWSSDRTFEIADEPPRAVGDVSWGQTNSVGDTEARWSFTPLLYAKSYDVEVGRDSSMRNAQELNVTSPNVSTYVSGQSYWRARARDGQGRIISDWSTAYRLGSPVPNMLAQNSGRNPAAEGTTSTRVERYREEVYEKNGWWGWFGLGDNYVDYRQSVPQVLSLDDHHAQYPSEYLEVGFGGKNGWGGVFSYKHTPGAINPDPAQGSIDNSEYDWDTYAMEGIYKKESHYSLFGSPVVIGTRIGLQIHHMPFVVADTNPLDSNTLLLKYETMTNASAGLLAEITRRRWTYYWMMRYQYPLSTKADGSSAFSIKPVFGFDGSLGLSYNITRQFKAGAFWYGQWHQFNFHYTDGTNDDSGFQTLFYSSFDMRLGWDF